MATSVVVIAGAILVAAVAALITVIVSLSIRREERIFGRTGEVSLTRRAPGPVSYGARYLVGLYVRQADAPRSPLRRADAPRSPLRQHEDTLV